MIDREDLTFATVYQLAGEIKTYWEGSRPEIVDQALAIMSLIEEPESTMITKGGGLVVTFGEEESTAVKKARLGINYTITLNALKTVIAQSDDWNTKEAINIKKELVSRIKDYEQKIKKLVEPSPITCEVKL